MQEGQRSTCRATLSDDTAVAVEFVQTNDRGDVTFRIRDSAALETLGPMAEEVIERWRAGEVEAIHRDAHPMLQDDSSLDTLSEMLSCTAADYGGLDSTGAASHGLIHRKNRVGELYMPLHFDGGLEVTATLTFAAVEDQWKLGGINVPAAPQDLTTTDPGSLLTIVVAVLARADAGRWNDVCASLSHELRREQER